MRQKIASVVTIFLFYNCVNEVAGQSVIETMPDSFYVELFLDQKVVKKLTISNIGDSYVPFNISIVPPSDKALKSRQGVDAVSQTIDSAENLTAILTTTSSSPKPAVATLTSTSRSLVPADFLVIDHGKVKTFLNNYTYSLISEVDLNTLSVNDFNQFEVIYFEPDWFDYNNLSNNMSKISEYVESGGVVVINVAGNIGDGLGIGPLGTNYANYDGNFGGGSDNFENIKDSSHPYITGEPYGGHLLIHTDFSWWFTTDHGHLFNYPPSSKVVLDTYPQASWLEYKLGSGYVIVTTLTYGWGLGGARGNPLENLVKYSIYLAQAGWLSMSATSGALPPDSSTELLISFDAADLVAGDYAAMISIQSNDSIVTNLGIPVILHVSDFPCGDLNNDGIASAILDLAFLIDDIFRGGPSPLPLERADLNSDGSSGTILDLTFMIDDIFRGGPSPTCGL